MKMLKDLAEVVREVEIKPGCWTDTEIMLRRFIRTHHATITDMAKRLEAAERDAARYRWLVDNCQECPDALGMGGQLYFGTYSGVDGIDQAIDAAMQEPTDRRTPERPE